MWLSKIYYLYQIFPAFLYVFSFLLTPSIFIESSYRNKTLDKKAIPIKKHYSLAVLKRVVNDSELEKIYKDYGLVDVSMLDSTIIVDLRYAGTNNFLRKNMYGNIRRAFLQKDVAQKIVKASALLKEQKPNLRLVILDAARPLSIQKLMWTDIVLPNGDKEKFVSSPQIGSLHNFGAAVDVTLSTAEGNYLDMGTSYDSFSDTAYTVNEDYLLKSGKLNLQQYQNRRLLREIMTKAGFTSIETEWWHFNSCSRNYARTHYPLIVSHIYNENPLLAHKAKVSAHLPEMSSIKVEFRIQIFASVNKYSVKDPKFKKLNVQYYKQDNFYKYTTGHFISLETAMQYLEQIKDYGFNDAFVVAFNNNERISIKDAIELLHNAK
ncbi:MAG: M15 family metallopeptidase [Bacteroidales bacterium]